MNALLTMNVWSLEEPTTIQESQHEHSNEQCSQSVHDRRLDPIRVKSSLMIVEGNNSQEPLSHSMVTKSDDDSMDSFDSDCALPQEQQAQLPDSQVTESLWNRGECAVAPVVPFPSPPTTVVWPDEYQLRFHRAREEMFEHLKNRLQAKCGSSDDSILPSATASKPLTNKSSTNTTNHIEQTAKALEHLLYRHCQKNIKVYQDRATLDARLRGLMMILVRRRMVKRTRQHKPATSSNGISRGAGAGGASVTVQKSVGQTNVVGREKESIIMANTSTSTSIANRLGSTRGDVLKTILGESKYKEIKDLLFEIRLVKMKKVATFCTSQQCASLRLNGGGGGAVAKTFDTQLPKVVRQLYFETPLVDCFEKYPLDKLAQLPWQDLVHQAQGNLLNYQLWELQLNESTGG